MNADCAAAREWLLEADLAELRSNRGPHAQHIESCAACRAVARTLLHGHAQLDEALSALAPERKVRRLRRRWPLWIPLPLAAAAVLALLLTRGEKLPAPPSARLAQMLMPATPIVTPPAGKQAVILEKNDLTVVWLY
ncbi:MAG TPA: hypothetical protein VF021_09210 [Longimicrobiales bacterium]